VHYVNLARIPNKEMAHNKHKNDIPMALKHS